MDTATKCCSKCGEVKPLSDYYRNKRCKDGYYNACKSCVDKQAKEWRAKNPGIKSKYQKTYKQRYPERVTKVKRNFKLKSPEKVLKHQRTYAEKHRIERNAKQAERSKTPLGIAARHRRYARVRNLPYSFTSVEWEHAVDYFDHRCAACERPVGLWHSLSADHWIPVSNPSSPGTVAGNIVPLCSGIGGCNQSKGSKNPTEWLIARFGKRRAKQIAKKIADYFESLHSIDP